MSNVKENHEQAKMKIFQTVLSSPGMTEKCKLNLAVSRQNIIFLSQFIESGLNNTKEFADDQIIASLPEECAAELRAIQEEILEKVNLKDFYEKLKSL